jgi:hypothetical protein
MQGVRDPRGQLPGDQMNFNGRYILDAHGDPQPCHDLIEWAMWFETSRDVRKVALDQIGPYTVSTIFLALDFSFVPMTDPLTYEPVLWETIVFAGDSPIAQRRYASREAAISGHQEFVREVEKKNALEEGSVFDNRSEDSPAEHSDQHPKH